MRPFHLKLRYFIVVGVILILFLAIHSLGADLPPHRQVTECSNTLGAQNLQTRAAAVYLMQQENLRRDKFRRLRLKAQTYKETFEQIRRSDIRLDELCRSHHFYLPDPSAEPQMFARYRVALEDYFNALGIDSNHSTTPEGLPWLPHINATPEEVMQWKELVLAKFLQQLPCDQPGDWNLEELEGASISEPYRKLPLYIRVPLWAGGTILVIRLLRVPGPKSVHGVLTEVRNGAEVKIGNAPH